MKEASHLFSISFNVASVVDFFAGMAAGEDADFFGASVILAGELLFVGAGEGESSVEIDTLGCEAGDSDFSDAAASRGEPGAVVSSCARANGVVATTNAVRARMIIFICMFPFGSSS